jgi:hypothetical protein
LPGDTYLDNVGGTLTQKRSTQTTAGAGDAGKIPALDAAGKLALGMMPVGVGAEVSTVTASEALVAGDYVNIWNDTGTPKVRKADATAAGKEAHGFVLAGASSASPALVYHEGTNTQVTGQTAGNVFLSTTPGLGTTTPPSGAGNVVQRLGVAISATAVSFEPQQPVTLASA